MTFSITDDGEGFPVVLLHSGVTDASDYDHLAADLARDRRVIRYDRRGAGGTPPATETYRDHDDLIAVLDQLGVEQADVVGNSYGGRMALELAANRPERVRRLALLAPAVPGWDWGPEMSEYDGAEEAATEKGDFDEVLRLNQDVWIKGVGRDWTPDLRAFAEAMAPRMYTVVSQQAVAWEYGEGPERALSVDRLAEITAPTLVVVGEHDLPDFAAIAGVIAERVPGARRVDLPGLAHLLPAEGPDVVTPLVGDFLRAS